MKKIFDIKAVKVGSVTCSAVVSLVAVGKYIYVLTTHSGDNKKKQPCVLHRYDTSNGKYVTKVIKTSNGSTNIAVHANSLTYNVGENLFYMVTRNGAGPKYNQILAFNKNGVIEKKYKYNHEGSKIATLNYSRGAWFITVNGGNVVRTRQIIRINGYFKDVDEEKLIFDHPMCDESVGNDTFISDLGYIIATKCSTEDYCYNGIFAFDLIGYGSQKRAEKTIFVSAPEGYTKFEVEGVCLDGSGRQYIAVNGVKDGKQADGVWVLWDL